MYGQWRGEMLAVCRRIVHIRVCRHVSRRSRCFCDIIMPMENGTIHSSQFLFLGRQQSIKVYSMFCYNTPQQLVNLTGFRFMILKFYGDIPSADRLGEGTRSPVPPVPPLLETG